MESQEEVFYLSDLKVGSKAKVKKIYTSDPVLKRRLLDMGITRGAEVVIKKISPLGDPVDILVRGYELCLRREDLKAIGVEIIQ